MYKFQAGSTYYTRYIGDSDLKVSFKILARTGKNVTLASGKRCKIHLDSDGSEFIYPEGRYSMALVIRAEREVIEKPLSTFAAEYGTDSTEAAIAQFLKQSKALLVRFSGGQVVYQDFF